MASPSKSLSADIPKPVSNLLDDLKFANGLPSGSRLSVHNRRYSSFSIIESVNRTFWGESRITTYNWINDLIDRAMDIGKRHPAWQDIIKEHVGELKQPINILKQTYRDDPNIVTKLQTLIYRTQYPLFSGVETPNLDRQADSIPFNKPGKNHEIPQSYTTALGEEEFNGSPIE